MQKRKYIQLLSSNNICLTDYIKNTTCLHTQIKTNLKGITLSFHHFSCIQEMYFKNKLQYKHKPALVQV